jgi:hypothetical protein
MSRTIGLAALFALTSLCAMGCYQDKEKKQPTLSPVTTSTPGTVAELSTDVGRDYREIRITEGIAIAVRCADSKGTPCKIDGSAMADEGIASLRRAYTDAPQTVTTGRSSYSQVSYLNQAAFVVVGKRVGRTVLKLQTGEREVEVQVEVLPARP